jgi:tetratricopeptide (TPR) repeat protein
VESAMAAGRRALELDPTLGEAYAALGLASTMAWSFEDAEEYFARALDLTPGYATAHHWAGNHRAALGQTEEGIELLRRALELDPFAPRIHQDLVNRLREAGWLDEAIQVLERGAELDPGYADYYLDAWRVYASAGEEDRALEALLRAHALAPASGLSADAVRAAFRDAGLAGAIRLVLERAPATFHSNFSRAQAERYVGDTDAALRSLERAVEGHDAVSAWIFSGRLSEPLEDDPRFQALVRRVGVPGFR